MAKRSRKAAKAKKPKPPAAPKPTAAPPPVLTERQRSRYAGYAKVHEAKASEHAATARVYREMAGG